MNDEKRITFLKEYLKPLIGARIKDVSIQCIGRDVGAVLLVELAPGDIRHLAIMSDEEGNGAGFIDGLDLPGTWRPVGSDERLQHGDEYRLDRRRTWEAVSSLVGHTPADVRRGLDKAHAFEARTRRGL